MPFHLFTNNCWFLLIVVLLRRLHDPSNDYCLVDNAWVDVKPCFTYIQCHACMPLISCMQFIKCCTVVVGVLDRGILNQLVNLCCVFPIPDGDAKRHKAYTGSGNRCPTSSLRYRSCIPCTEVLVVGGYKLGERESWSQVSA